MNNVLKDVNNKRLADVLTFVPGLEQNKVINRLYNGSYQIQTIGNPASYFDVEIFIYRTEMDLINLAEARAEVLLVSYNGLTYVGCIEAPVQWDPVIKGESYKGKIKFLIVG